MYSYLQPIRVAAHRYASRHLTVKTRCLRHNEKKGAQLKRMRSWKPPHTGLSHYVSIMSQTLCLDCYMSWRMPVCGLPKAWTVFARLNSGFVVSNPTQDMVICVLVFCDCLFLCVGSGLETGWSPFQTVLLTDYRIKILKKRPSSN
jgi:hypothetical protein